MNLLEIKFYLEQFYCVDVLMMLIGRMMSNFVWNFFVHVNEHLVDGDDDDHDEVNFHRLDEISLQLYFSMFVNLLDEEYYDVVMNSR